MSRHRAPHRSFFRATPLGAGMTVALLAAGTGSAFAAPADVVVPSTPLSCADATAAVGAQQKAVVTATEARDAARAALQKVRTELRNAQKSYDAVVDKRDDARDRLDSLLNRRDRREVAVTSAQKRVDDLKKRSAPVRSLRSAEGDLARAQAALSAVDGEIKTARANLATAEAAMTTAKAPTEAQREAVKTARATLAKAEADLEKAQGLRRTARADRSQACAAAPGPTTGVTTLGQ